MDVLIPGIEYLLSTSDKEGMANKTAKPVHMVFCHKNALGEFIHGLTTEELLRVLIHRQGHMVHKQVSTENVECLLHLQHAYEAATRRLSNKINDKKKSDSA